MKSMLEELRTKDIDLWREIQGFRSRYERQGMPELSLCDSRLLDHIIGSVARACEARGWYWQAAHGEYIGYVASVLDGSKIVEGSTAAEAMLRAYLEAL
jgi:hypothetical protein